MTVRTTRHKHSFVPFALAAMFLCRAASAAEVREKLSAFSYADVEVTGGPMADQAAGARGYYLALDEDSLLQGFRLRAGLPAPGKPMGGWYDPEGFAAAHPFGQYISALSRMYANTHDPRYKEKVARLVHGFHRTMRADGYFYASDTVARNWPCYLYDKIAAGMREAYTLTGNKEALVVLSRMTDWADKNMPRRSDEWYTLSENLYKCYALTKEKRYLRMAAEFDYSKDYYDSFAAGVNAFTPERHAYSHVNSLVSAGQAYESTGDGKYLKTIVNAWNFLTGTQMYASGGWGPNEHFVVAGAGELAASVRTSTKTFETPCGAYANVNLDRQLLRFTADSKYGDNMERVLLNGMLAALPPQPDGHSFYYSDYHPGAQKKYFPFVWPCCSGTYAEITADYPLDVYFHDAQGIYVNLFAPSRARWSAHGTAVSVEQKTSFPLSDATALLVHAARPAPFALSVRIPDWTARAPAVRINGVPLEARARPGTFLRIERTWREGDVLQVEFPMALHFEAIDAQTPDRAALMYGPLLLVALADKDVELAGDAAHPENWIKPAPDGAFRFRAEQGSTFAPFYSIRDERYTTYCRLKPPRPL